MSPLKIEARVSGTEKWEFGLEARPNDPASLDFTNSEGHEEHLLLECSDDDSKGLMTELSESALIKDHPSGKVDIIGVSEKEPTEIKPGESVVLSNVKLSEVEAALDFRFTHYRKGE